jgi:hypothetical protein
MVGVATRPHASTPPMARRKARVAGGRPRAALERFNQCELVAADVQFLEQVQMRDTLDARDRVVLQGATTMPSQARLHTKGHGTQRRRWLAFRRTWRYRWVTNLHFSSPVMAGILLSYAYSVCHARALAPEPQQLGLRMQCAPGGLGRSPAHQRTPNLYPASISSCHQQFGATIQCVRRRGNALCLKEKVGKSPEK